MPPSWAVDIKILEVCDIVLKHAGGLAVSILDKAADAIFSESERLEKLAANSEKLKSLKGDIEGEPLVRVRAKELFSVCLQPESADLMQQYHAFEAKLLEFRTLEDRYALMFGKDQAPLVELHQKVWGHAPALRTCADSIVAMLSTMVALWRSLKPAESRATVCAAHHEKMHGSVIPCSLPRNLASLLVGAKEGKPAFAV